MVAASKTVLKKAAVTKSAPKVGAAVKNAKGLRTVTSAAASAVHAANGSARGATQSEVVLAAPAKKAVRGSSGASGGTPVSVAPVHVVATAKAPARAGKKAPPAVTPEFARPDYWDKACADLLKRDRIMKKLIPQFGPVHLMTRGDPFVTLARSIVGQQISVSAAQAVWLRIQAACPKLTPAQFIKVGHDKLAACGLSKRKSEYILDLAQHFVSGALHVATWTTMDDEAVIAELTQIRGIGRWTAEMFLIFNLVRPDVLPLDDVGLIRAISVNYFSGEPVTRSEAREVAANWEPWRTVATWYMWRSLDPLPVAY
jgi:DNA-3-methyladenine glycosylase II